jgi:hypothetical protein
MATTDKPQGQGPGKNPGGLFVDPLSKWEDDAPDMPGAPETTGKGRPGTSKADKFKSEARDILIQDVDKAADKIGKLIKTLAKPGLSRSERADVNRALVQARNAFKEITQSSNKLSLELRESRRLEAEAYGKLNRLKTWRTNAGSAGLSKEQEQQLNQTEHMLRNFIKTSNIYRQGDNHLNEDVRKELFNKMDQLVDNIGDLPDYVQEMFSDEDKKIDLLLKRQLEAKEFVKAQNESIKKFMWKAADKIGYGAFNLGNVIRGGRAIYNLPKNVKSKLSAASDKIGAARDYVSKTIEMRRIAKNPIVGDDELKSVGAGNDPGATVLERYAQASERFRRRLLDRFGKKKEDKAKPEEDKGLLQGALDFFGKGGFLKNLLGLLGKVSVVAIAGAVGYWIGTKIYDKIGPALGKRIDNVMGLDRQAELATAPVQLNTAQNFARAQEIHQAMQKPLANGGRRISEEDAKYYDYFRHQNPGVDLDKSYAPSESMKKINAKQAAGAGGGRGSINPAAAVPTSVTLPDQGAGGGRGSINPAMASPSINPVSTGGQISDAIGKSVTVSGNANVAGLNPAMGANLKNMADEYFQATGKKLQINSGFRSPEDQARLFKSMPPGMAAKPGSSLHNYGLAVDVQSAQANELANLGLLQKYGFVRPIPNEKWHMQPAGVTVAAAKSGVYSADAPSNQGGGNQVAQGKPASVQVASAEPRIPVAASEGGAGGGGGSGGGGGTMSGASKKSVSDIPTFDTSDGMLTGMNLGVIAS